MSLNPIIRAYKSSDKAAVLNILRLNTPAYFATEEEQDFIFYLDHELELYFVIEIDNAVVGCGGINFIEDNTHAKISWDLLHPAFQGKGIGTQLLQHRNNIIKNIERIKTITVRTSQLAYKFYERSGFKLVNTVKDYWAPGFDLYEMRLPFNNIETEGIVPLNA